MSVYMHTVNKIDYQRWKADRLHLRDYPHKPPDYRHMHNFLGLVRVKVVGQRVQPWEPKQTYGQRLPLQEFFWWDISTFWEDTGDVIEHPGGFEIGREVWVRFLTPCCRWQWAPHPSMKTPLCIFSKESDLPQTSPSLQHNFLHVHQTSLALSKCANTSPKKFL